MHQALPIGHIEEHFFDLSRFALASAYVTKSAFEGTAIIQHDGRVPLPGLGFAFVAGREQAGRKVVITADAGELSAIVESERFTTAEIGKAQCNAGDRGWFVSPRLDWGMFLDDSLEMSRVHMGSNQKWSTRALDPDYVSEWRSKAHAACELICIIEKDLWVPVRSVLSSIVPVAAPRDLNLSATQANALGCISSSLPDNVGVLAETFVHEAAHTTLHIISDTIGYWRSRDDDKIYRSPWRKDLRPISGMFHGIFAFLAAGEFWSLLLQRGAKEFEALGRIRLETVSLQIQEALAEVNESPSLTTAGRRLLSAAEDKLKQLRSVAEHYPANLQDESKIQKRLACHREEVSVEPNRESSMPHRLDPSWSRQFEAVMPPPINRFDCRLIRRENISDTVQIAVVNNDPVVSKWCELLKVTTQTEPESASLVHGSICYARGDFPSAIDHYLRYVEARWEDLDAWRLLGAALRRAGRCLDALAITFDIDQLLKWRSEELRQEWGTRWPFHLDESIRKGSKAREYGN